MSIESIEALPLRLKRDEAYLGPLPPHADVGNYFIRPPYRCLYSATYETVFVRLRTSEGVTAWGEALAPVAPEVVCSIIDQLLAPALVGRDPLGAGRLWHLMYNLMRDRGYYGGHMLDAISAIDIALWDARGKLQDQPVHALLGGAFFDDAIPCYVSGLPRPDDDGRVELALDWQGKGFNAFKLSAGYGVHADVTTMSRLREALGAETTLLLDAHWAYTPAEAMQLGRQLEALDTGFFEAAMNPGGHRRARASGRGAGHSGRHRRDRAHPLSVPALAGTARRERAAAGHRARGHLGIDGHRADGRGFQRAYGATPQRGPGPLHRRLDPAGRRPAQPLYA